MINNHLEDSKVGLIIKLYVNFVLAFGNLREKGSGKLITLTNNCLVFLKCIFEFMINTASTASNSVYRHNFMRKYIKYYNFPA